jgi:hypothetical protein
MYKRKPKWPETLLHYLMTRATPVDGMVWVKPQRSLRPKTADETSKTSCTPARTMA